MTVAIVRVQQNLDGMFGSWSINGEHQCVTVEPPWKNSKADSCIPAGQYRCVTHRLPEGLVYLIKDVPNRKDIFIRPAFVSAQLKGGIAPGRTFKVFPEFEGKQGVTSSKFTLEVLRSKLPSEFTLTILDPS